jgi:uncharacterized membrane protein
MKTLQAASLIAATVTTGITAGVLAAFAFSVMPGIRGTDDRVFVDVMNRMNNAILNGWFLTAFMGGLIFSGAALVLHWRGDGRPALPWIIAGLGLYLVMFIITRAINVPLNDKLLAAGKSSSRLSDFVAARNDFEGRWVTWNIIRTVANTAALGCLVYALVVFGRSTAKVADPSVLAAREGVAVTQTDPAWAPPASDGRLLVDVGGPAA